MTTETPTTDPLKSAATIARQCASDAPADTPDRRLCAAYAVLFEYAASVTTIPDTALFGLIIEAAEALVELDDGATANRAPRPALSVLDRALDIMVTNAEVSRPGSAPKELAESIVALIVHAQGEASLVDLLYLVRRFAAAVVAVDEAAPAELALERSGPGEFPVGVHLDGSIAAGQVPGYEQLVASGKSTSAILRVLLDQADGQADDIKQGADFARAHFVDVPADSKRFRMRTGPSDPTRIDVHDEHGDRVAIITERRDGAEWRCSMLTPDETRTLDVLTFPRAVEALDAFLAPPAGQAAAGA